jgi:Leucine-rich repeat (LRR) protein
VRSVLPCLTELHADRNALVELPFAIWACPHLTYLSLCANRLTLSACRMPTDLAAFYDGVDTLPNPDDAGLAPLQHLDLGENQLGALPPLHLYPSLREVHLQQNGLRELPFEQLRPLRLLQTFDVSMNDVSALPPQLALLPKLQNLTIVGNPIRSIPQNVQQKGSWAVIDLLKKRCPEGSEL